MLGTYPNAGNSSRPHRSMSPRESPSPPQISPPGPFYWEARSLQYSRGTTMRRWTVGLIILAMGPMSRAEDVKDKARLAEVVEGNNRFAFDLYGRLRDRPGNLFASPYSLSTALAMTYAGARGQTAEEMAATLHYSVPPAALHPAFAALDRQLNDGKGRRYKLAVANALWGQEGETFLPDF